jgi:hypothetical protein
MSNELHSPSAAVHLEALMVAAEKDESGVALRTEMGKLRLEIGDQALQPG